MLCTEKIIFYNHLKPRETITMPPQVDSLVPRFPNLLHNIEKLGIGPGNEAILRYMYTKDDLRRHCDGFPRFEMVVKDRPTELYYRFLHIMHEIRIY